MKKVLFTVMTLLMVAGLVYAMGGNGKGRPNPGTPQPLEVVSQFLELSPEQMEAWVQLLQVLHEQTGETLAAIHELEMQLQEALKETNPDLELIGQLVLQIHELKGSIRQEVEIYRTEFKALLNEAQLEKLDAIIRAAELARFIPAFEATFLI